ncbi:ATP synthase F1 subunit delta [uncultured Ruminococcus sp.]|uniref:ATP synthase F1 subunit delta n=1 Tax=uncultured Ruminococcus sp. TaxID=165186 RepID=UPI00260A3CA8|nr:ATP synthase F1 subunit delta [uncultured Ruminococcus sp.]
MKQAVTSYATVLLTLPAASETVPDARNAFETCPQLTDALSNPTIPETEKFGVIDRVFPEALRTFLKVVCRNGQIDSVLDIFSEYEALERRQRQCAHAVLEYVTPLTDAQLSAMKQMICAKTGKPEVQLELRQNPALLGGFILHVGDETYDRSVRSSLKSMRKSLIRR